MQTTSKALRATISVNSAPLGKPVLVRIWDNNAESDQPVYQGTFDKKASAIQFLVNYGKQHGKVTVESTI